MRTRKRRKSEAAGQVDTAARYRFGRPSQQYYKAGRYCDTSSNRLGVTELPESNHSQQQNIPHEISRTSFGGGAEHLDEKLRRPQVLKSTSNKIISTRKPLFKSTNFCHQLHLPAILFLLFHLSICDLLHNFSTTPIATIGDLIPIRVVNCERRFKLPLPSTSNQIKFPLPTRGSALGGGGATPFESLPTRPSASSLPDLIVQQGGIVGRDKNVTLTKQHNPILITKDIVVKRDAKLTIESGVELYFEKRIGILVSGTLEILGKSNDRVKLNLLKSQQSATVNFRSQLNSNQNINRHNQQVRLVDGDLPSEGRVQIKLNERWNSLCTNSKNLTAADIKVLCRQAGFQEGAYYKWFAKRRNETTGQILAKSFHCSGNELTLSQCKSWNRIRVGGGVCDQQSDLGIKCSRALVFASGGGGDSEAASSPHEFWRGIEFLQSETALDYTLGGQMRRKVSRSQLSHVSISEAGLNEVGNATAAIRVFGQPPKLNQVEIKNSIYGIVIEEADDAIEMANIKLLNNMGLPLFVNTSWGQVSLSNLHVENNGGDAIRVVRHEKTLVGSHDFCKFANLGTAQSYPVVLSHEQQFLTAGRECCQEFVSQNQLTVHFTLLRSTRNNLLPDSDSNRRVTIPTGVALGRDAALIVYDDYRDEAPFKLRIQNGTRAQSIVSRSGRLRICYEPASYRTVLFTLEIVASDSDGDAGQLDVWTSTGIARDFEISNSFIGRNNGRGIWLDNQRSGVRITNTTVILNNYLAGVHLENGTGEVIVRDSFISNNTGHGLLINLAGGYYHIDNSTISDNSLKGILIDYDKRPELVPFNHTMHLGYSLIARNGENGLFVGNVCRSDAFWNVSMNSFVRNGEDAIHFESCFPSQETVLKFGNLSSRLNLSEFESGENANANSASEQLVPTKASGNNLQELFITHNVFFANSRRAIHMRPVYFVKSFIRHNLFKNHSLAVIYISNSRLFEQLDNNTSAAPANIRVSSNRFYFNRGRYVVNIGLQEDNPKHSLVFTKNYLEENEITEPFSATSLRPRSRVSAVVVVSSSNTKVLRNRFENPTSTYELGAHLEAHSKVINATANFWGHNLNTLAIYKRIFDRKNRYNLAQVEFLQYLMSPDDLEYITDLSFDRERDKIITFRSGNTLGGEIKGFEELNLTRYNVRDDIFIRPGGHLVVRPETKLYFDDGVGMMVQGRLDVLGTASGKVLFTSSVPLRRLPDAVSSRATSLPPTSQLTRDGLNFNSDENDGDDSDAVDFDGLLLRENRTSSRRTGARLNKQRGKRQLELPAAAANVRLSHKTMGRLEVQLDGTWGSVCDYNFDIDDAAVACQQLGMILNKDDWLLQRFQYAANEQQQISMAATNALMTNLRCDPTLDTDLTQCKAELSLRGDFDGVCNSEVGIRCFPPAWSGVRLGIGAEVSTLEHLSIRNAGMFDYANYQLKPALTIDFNRHLISSLESQHNIGSGLGIMWNDVIGRHFSELTISDSLFQSNERHGVELRSRGLTLKNCKIVSSRQSGLDYNPTLAKHELEDLMSWLYTPKTVENIVTITFPLKTNYFSVPSSEDSYRFFVIPRHSQQDLKESFTIGTEFGHMLSVHLLNPINQDSSESLNMSLGTNPDSPLWDLRVNTTSFPMLSPSYKFHFNYTSGQRPRGNIVLYIRSKYNNRDLKVLAKFIPQHLILPKFEQTASNVNSKLINSIVISNCTFSQNGIGLKFKHSDYAYNSNGAFNRRYANETTNITNCHFDRNHFSAIFVGSEEYELNFDAASKQLTTASEIRYNLVGNVMRYNKDGIRQFSRDIRQTHNVFHWTVNNTLFEANKGGGISITLPYFWRYDTNLSHTVELGNNSFLRNLNFELGVEGHFAKLNLTNNKFRENKCRNKLIYFNGMEKQLMFKFNLIEQNVCNRLIDFNIQSHADKLGSVSAELTFNSIRYNRRAMANFSSLATSFKFPSLLHRLHPQATDYTLALNGIQSLNVSRNLFVNPELRFELVVAIIMDSDERTVSAVENYWGSARLDEISGKIFDFDDWNNYAVAEFSPFLSQDSFLSAIMVAEPPLDSTTFGGDVYSAAKRPLAALGGRLMRSMVLPYRKEPYLVESDFTVMPNVRLTIERGVTLEFMPSVGILVLGELVAAGTQEKPILMRALLSASDLTPLRQYLFPEKLRPNISLTSLSARYSHETNYALKHLQLTYPIDMGLVRLCKNEICNDGNQIYDNNVEDNTLRKEALKGIGGNTNLWKLDGFLEIFNMTTLQWVPVCDPLFTEHTARVVCKQLGYSHLSLFKRGRRYTIEQEQITSIRNWPASVQCDGNESNLASCPLAATEFMNHTTSCRDRLSNQFVYVYCSDFPEAVGDRRATRPQLQQTSEHLNFWGGIRLSCPTRLSSANGVRFEPNVASASNQIGGQPVVRQSGGSRLQYVNIESAGMLHRKRAPAIQVLQCNVQLEYLTVENSAHHAVEIISSHGNQNFHQLKLRNNLGVGLNYLSIAGSSSASRTNPYLPLKHLDISTDIFGLVDVCGASKEIRIEERLLLFYKYDSRPKDCVKIISSKLNVKHLGIRVLHFDLLNSSSFTPLPDYVKIYDGNIFDRDSRLLVELGVTERHRVERPELRFYQSSDSTMTLRLHVSGSSSLHGFIAEVITTPISYSIQRDAHSNLTFSEITNNKLGALMVSSAGESSPNLVIKNNRFELNCMHLFGNFTSCLSPINMELQNCPQLKFSNNLIKSNQGGLMLKSYSHTAVSALDAHIDQNVFEANENTNTLALIGPKTDPYQTVRVVNNFFTRNSARYLSNIVLSRIVANFSGNIVSGNVGKHQIEVIGFDKLPLSYQTFNQNWMYNNSATYEQDRSTIFGNSAGQQYYMNYLVNPDNHFELSTMNWSRYDVRPLQVPRDDEIIHLISGDGSSKDVFRKTADSIPISVVDSKRLDIYHATINAKHNWWGFSSAPAIQGRIRDRMQHDELIKVDFAPFLTTNSTVLSGVCAGGWRKVGQACLVYVGTRMSYQEARDFCDRERATLPLLRGSHYEFTEFIQTQELNFEPKVERVWVRSFEVSRGACPALNDWRTRNFNCQDKNTFLCEKDPQIVVSLLNWHYETGGLIALILALITIVLTTCCSICWAYKSRQRHKEKIERKSTLYASMRSNRGGPYASSNSLSELFLHRQLYNSEKQSISDLSPGSQSTQATNLDDLAGIQLDPSGNTAFASIKKYPSFRASNTNQYQQNSNNNNSPVYTSGAVAYGASRAAALYQPATNPSYVDSPLPAQLVQEQPYKVPTPAPSYKLPVTSYKLATPTPSYKVPTPTPSYKEIHPRALSRSSRTPSYTGSFASDNLNGASVNNLVITDPMPDERAPQYSRADHLAPVTQRRKSIVQQPRQYDYGFDVYPPPGSVELPPPLSYEYSNINLDRPTFNAEQALLNQRQQQRQSSIDESASSVPTYYSNQIETFEESTHSYLEEYNIWNDASNKIVQNMSNDQVSYMMTERSSITDLMVNSSQHTTIDSQFEPLISTNPRGLSDLNLNLNGAAEQRQPARLSGSTEKALSEAGSNSNRYYRETSFDFEAPKMATAPTFGGSQRLSPVSSTFEGAPMDSKLGSRVYLETSFE